MPKSADRSPSNDDAVRLRRVREAMGLSQREMAAELGVAHGAVAQWETGANPLPGPVLKLLALYEDELALSAAPLEGALGTLRTSSASRNLALSTTAARAAAQVAFLAFERALLGEERASALTTRTQAALARRIVATLGQMKGFAMKVGQMASYLDFAVPEAARAPLATLQVQSPAMAPSVVAEIFLEELGSPPRRLFAEWSPQPFAAASIGQVHRARLRTGEEVAVKVQYPRIVEAIEADLRTAGLVNQASALIFRGLDPHGFASELRERFLEECDYRQEAANQEQFRTLWAGRPGVRVPRIFPALTTRRILVMELARGESFAEFTARATPAERNRAGEILFRFAYESILRHGLFNADPHPGNYLFSDGEVTFLDFGCTKRFGDIHMARWRGLLCAMLERDLTAAAQRWVELGIVPSPARFDFAYHHAMVLLLHSPWLVDRPFRFTIEYVERTWRMAWLENRNRFRVNMPKDWVFINRLEWGLYAVLAKLGAEGDWRSIVLDLLYPPGTPRPRPYSQDELALMFSAAAPAGG